MTPLRGKRGLILFGLILVLIAVASWAAYRLTGPMGIEERFTHAVGLPGTDEESGTGWFGFSLEGNPLAYAVILGGLGIACAAAYRYAKR
jgi:hypothetical protein